jgi:hypothetical protein
LSGRSLRTMASVDETLSAFIEAWNEGQRPDVDEYLERAPAGERKDLADLIRTFLLEAPVPSYSEETLVAIGAEPGTRKAAALLDEETGLWPSLLPRLRHRMKLKREEVVVQLAELLGVGADAPKVRAYYHEMETGTLDPEGVSRRVLDALARIFGVSAGELETGGEYSVAFSPEAAFLRRLDGLAGSADHVLAESMEYGSPGGEPEEWDEVDRLFRGGRDA